MRTFRHASRGRREDGAVAIEFGIIAPLMILLVMGIIDFGWMINRDTMVNNISRDAVRVASLEGTYADVESQLLTGLESYGIDEDKVDYTITCENPSGTNCDGTSASFATNAASGSRVIVTIEYSHDLMTPVGALCHVVGDGCVGSTKVLRKTSVMVRE